MKALIDSDQMKRYLEGILARAEHHAQNVEACVMAVFGAVIAFKDKGTELKVLEQDGEMKNVLWAEIKGKRFAFTYNHKQQQNDMREKSIRGPVKASFDDTWTLREIRQLFADL